MDNADRSAMNQRKQGILRKDPLEGYDIVREYSSIANGTSKLAPRIQNMVTKRYKGERK